MKKKIDIPLIIIFVIAATILVLSLLPQIKIIEDEAINNILKDGAARFAFAVLFFYLIFTSKWREQLKFNYSSKALLWSVPVILVALVNFPYSSLILGTSTIIKGEYVGILIFYCLSISLLEELFFRILLFNFIFERFKNRKHKYIFTILITSVLFGLWHLVNLINGASIGYTLLQVGYTFLIGCMLSVTLTITRNIWLCVIVHLVFDFGGMFVNVLGEGDFQDFWFWVLTITMMVLCGIHIAVTAFSINKKMNQPAVVEPIEEDI